MTILKSIVLCLALANVGYFLWAHGIAKRGDGPVTASVATLKLASEAAATAPRAVGSGGGIAAAGGSVGLAAVADAANPASSTGTAASGNPRRCITVGPFRDVSEAAHAASTLRRGGYDPRQRVADGDVWAGVWVYLPIPASRSASDQVLAKLKGAGIDDALEMPGPGPADGSVISLGLFSEQKRAQARVVQAQALGFKPEIADRKRTGNVYWIDIDLKPTEATLNPSDLQADAGRITRLEVKPCPAAETAAPAEGQAAEPGQPAAQGQP